MAEHEAATYEGKVVVSEHGGFRFRRVWHDGEWWHSVADIVAAVAENTSRPRKYWDDLKRKLADEGFDQLSEKIGQLKLPAADGKNYTTDCATTGTMFRIVESVPSPRAEPIKQFLARVGAERLEEIAQPSKAVDPTATRVGRMSGSTVVCKISRRATN